jgi:hypothetical protein
VASTFSFVVTDLSRLEVDVEECKKDGNSEVAAFRMVDGDAEDAACSLGTLMFSKGGTFLRPGKAIDAILGVLPSAG